MQKEIHLRIEEPNGTGRTQWPVSQGVPFAEGELERETRVTLLDPAGNRVPVQTRCLATWRKDRRHVKWLLLDFLADTVGATTAVYRLAYGADADAHASGRGPTVTITEDEETITLTTGALDLVLRRNDPDFIQSMTVPTSSGRRELLRRDNGPFLYMEDDEGTCYSSLYSKAVPDISVEDRGPVRSSVCIRGFHADENGRRFCPYVLRLHVFAGSSMVKVLHTFVFDQDPDTVRLSAVGLRIPMRTAEHGRAAFGGETDSHWAVRWDRAQLFQRHACMYEVTLDGAPFASGSRAPGWVSASLQDGSVAVALRDMWREYPKGLTVDRDGIDVQLWPKENRAPLDLVNPWKEQAVRFTDVGIDEEGFAGKLREHPTAPLNLKSTGIGDRNLGIPETEAAKEAWRLARTYAPDRPAAFCDTHMGKAEGLAKTHELWLMVLGEPVEDVRASSFAASVNEPLIAPADPVYMASTGAVRFVHPRDVDRFPEAERELEGLFDDLVLTPREECGIYGMLNYGEMVNSHTRSNTFAYRAFRENPELFPNVLDVLGVFNNEAQDVIHQLWSFFVRTGERKYFLFAEAKSEHTEDVDFVHAHASRPDWVGLLHYHSVLNYSGGPSPSHTLVSGIMLHYYLTGNNRALDVARETADRHVRVQEPSGVISYRSPGLHREFTGPLSVVLELYQATWEEKYGALARRSLDFLHRAVLPSGNLPISVYAGGELGDEVWVSGVKNKNDYPGGMLCHILHDAYRLYGAAWLEDWILRLADSWIYDTPIDQFVHRSNVVFADEKTTGELRTIYEIENDWYLGTGSYGVNAIIPIIALAHRISGDARYAAYLKYHLDAFPHSAADCRALRSKGAFGAIHNYGYNVPAMMSAVAPALENEAAFEQARKEWIGRRAENGYPIYPGPRDIYDENGNLRDDLKDRPVDVPSAPYRDDSRVSIETDWEHDPSLF